MIEQILASAAVIGFFSYVIYGIHYCIKDSRRQKAEEVVEKEKLRIFLETENAKPKYYVEVIETDGTVHKTETFSAWGEMMHWYEPEAHMVTSLTHAKGWIKNRMKDGYATVNGIYIPTCNIKTMIPKEESNEQSN